MDKIKHEMNEIKQQLSCLSLHPFQGWHVLCTALKIVLLTIALSILQHHKDAVSQQHTAHILQCKAQSTRI